jgi:hypothetical protein
MSANGQPSEAPASTETAESGAQTTETTTTEAPQSDGLGRLYSRMEEMATQQREFMDTVQQQLAPPEEEPEFYDETGEMTDEGARAFIQEMVDERVNAQLQPREAERQKEARDDAFEALKDEYPELQDEAISSRVIRAAADLVRQLGHEEIIDRPGFVDLIEKVYVQEQYQELRAAQAADQPRSVVLESASGAARQHQPQEIDWQKRVIDAAQSDGPRI